MEKQRRLTRVQVVTRLREHAARYGYASTATLDRTDKIVLRSIPLHFIGIAAARLAAGVAGPPYQKPARKTGPKRGSKPSNPQVATWSRARVIAELRRLHRAGRSTTWQDLLNAGHSSLIRAANKYAGGLQRARRAARIPTPKRRGVRKNTWTKALVLSTIRARRRAGEPLAMTQLPQGLYNAARRFFGRWASALAAVHLDAGALRVSTKKYTKEVIVERLRVASESGSDLRTDSLARVLDLKAVRREFGTLHAALRAAGLEDRLRARRHGGAKWTRERVVEALQERAGRGIFTLTPGLHRVVQIYFGGAANARAAAGILSKTAWTRERVTDELRRRAARGDHALTPPLYRAARLLFGGARAARAAAGVPDPIDARRERTRRDKAAFTRRHRNRGRSR